MGPNTGPGHDHVHVNSPVGENKTDSHHVSDQRTRGGTNPVSPTNVGRIDTFETEMALEQSGRELDRKPNLDPKNLKNQHPSQHPIQAMHSRSSSRMMMMTMFTLKQHCQGCQSQGCIIGSQQSTGRGTVSTAVVKQNGPLSSMTGMKAVVLLLRITVATCDRTDTIVDIRKDAGRDLEYA